MGDSPLFQDFKRASGLLEEGHVRRAEKIADSLIEQGYSGGYDLKARCHDARGENGLAIDVLERGVRSAPRVPILWDLLGEHYSNDGRFSDALSAFQQARHAGGDESLSNYNLAVTYGRMGEFEQALRFIGSVSTSVSARLRLHAKAWFLAETGRLSEALETASELLEVEPGFASAHAQRALALQGLGRTSEAREAALRALAIDPTEEAALRTLCMQLPKCDAETHMYEVFALVKPKPGVEPFPGLRVDGFYRTFWAAAKSPQSAVQYFRDIVGEGYDCEIDQSSVVQDEIDGHEGVWRVAPQIVSFSVEGNPLKRLGLMVKARRWRPSD